MPRTIQSVSRTVAIIEALRENDGATIREIAAESELAPATNHAHLATLKEGNSVIQTGDEYRLGHHFLALGESVRNGHELSRASQCQIESLARETGEAAHLIIEHDGRIYSRCERFGQAAVAISYHDQKREQPLPHLHCTAGGKAILWQLSTETGTAMVDEVGLPRVTADAITERETLFAELETARDEGSAFSDQQQVKGIRAVGAPITGSDGEPAGAVTVSGPTARLTVSRFRDDLTRSVRRAASICEVNLQIERDATIGE